MKRQMIWMVGLLFMMVVGMQTSYAHGHHDIQQLQSHDSHIRTGIMNLDESYDSTGYVESTKLAVKSRTRNSISLAASAIVHAPPYWCTMCGCGFFGHSSDCGGGGGCYLHYGMACDNAPYNP